MAIPAALPAPTAATLHEAALNYLARYAATEAGLRAVLNRRIDGWARSTASDDRDDLASRVTTLKQDVRAVAAQLVAMGLVNDTAFAEQHAASLIRSGRSRRAITARLAAKGVDPDIARATIPDDPDTELAAALVLTRKRRIGPFRRCNQPDQAGQRREMAMLARAGFPRQIVQQALAMDGDEAEARIAAFRQ